MLHLAQSDQAAAGPAGMLSHAPSHTPSKKENPSQSLLVSPANEV